MQILLLFLFSFALNATEVRFRVLHTNDLHSHFDGAWKRDEQGVVKRMGGYARLIHEITSYRASAAAAGEQTLTLDAGDFYAGTIYHAVGPWSETDVFPEWEFFKSAGYDVVTLGNHEFDPGNRGVATMFAKRDGGPDIVSTNILLKDKNVIQNVLPYSSRKVRFQGQEINVAIMGILGPNGCLVSRTTRESVQFVGFNDENSSDEWSELLEHLQKQIDEIKKNHQVIILVMHAGNPEDEKFASNLKDIDLIIAGHTHRRYGEFVNGVPISQTGSFGAGLGTLELKYDRATDKLTVLNPVEKWTLPIENQGQSYIPFLKRTLHFKELAHKRFGTGLKSLSYIPKQDYVHSRELNNELGQFVTSKIRHVLNQNYEQKIDAYFTSIGLIRSSFYKGIEYDAADIFEMLSVGFDEELRPGPKTSVFTLSPDDVETVIEFMELYSRFSSTFAPAFSDSVKFEVRKYGIPFVNRIYNITLHGKPLTEYKRPIVVATNMFVAANVDLVPQKTYGLISISPMDLAGSMSSPQASNLPKEYELLIEALK